MTVFGPVANEVNSTVQHRHNWVELNWGEHQNEAERAAICIFVAFVYFFLQQIVVVV